MRGAQYDYMWPEYGLVGVVESVAFCLLLLLQSVLIPVAGGFYVVCDVHSTYLHSSSPLMVDSQEIDWLEIAN